MMGMMIFIMILIMVTIITMATIITMSVPDVCSNQAMERFVKPHHVIFHEINLRKLTNQAMERFVKPRLDKELLGMMFFSNQAMERFVKPRLDKELLGKERDLTAGQMMRLEAVSTNTIIMT